MSRITRVKLPEDVKYSFSTGTNGPVFVNMHFRFGHYGKPLTVKLAECWGGGYMKVYRNRRLGVVREWLSREEVHRLFKLKQSVIHDDRWTITYHGPNAGGGKFIGYLTYEQLLSACEFGKNVREGYMTTTHTKAQRMRKV